MPVLTSLEPPRTINTMDSVINTLTLSLRKYGRIVSVDMPSSEAKLLLSQLRKESLRALTAMAKTHALLAEMELLVAQKKLDTLKSESRVADAIHSSKPRLQKRSCIRKNCVRKSTPKSSPSPFLHKLDNKSKAIAKTYKNNSTCLSCVSKHAKSLISSQIKKQPIFEHPKCPTEVPLERKKSNSLKTVPETPVNMNKNSKIDVKPNKSEITIVSNDENQPKSINDAFETPPGISTSPIAKKIFGIANYNVDQQQTVTHSRKDDSKKTHQISLRTATPKETMNKKKQLKRAVESLKVSLPLNNVADKENLIKLKKLATKVTRTEKQNRQDTKDTSFQSKNANRQTKTTNNGKTNKIPPSVDKIEKEKQQRLQRREKNDECRDVIENIKEKPNLVVTEPVNKNPVMFPKQVLKRNSKLVDNNKKQSENATPVKLSVSLPLTKSNLAKFNRALQSTQSNNIQKIHTETTKEKSIDVQKNETETTKEQTYIVQKNKTETIKDQRPNKNVKKTSQAPSLRVSIPLNRCTLPNIENKTTSNKENPNKFKSPELKCGNDERKQSQNSQDKTPLSAWRNIDWGSWGVQRRCNEEKNPVEGVQRRKYETWANGPMRKVSWEMFTRRLNMSVPNPDQPCPDPPAKKTCLEPRTDDAEKDLQATSVIDNKTTEELNKLPITTKPAEIECRIEESTKKSIVPDMADNLETTNAVFKHIMIKKEFTENTEDTRSISSDQTAIICTACQCLHETKICPNRKYFKFLGVDNFKTEF